MLSPPHAVKGCSPVVENQEICHAARIITRTYETRKSETRCLILRGLKNCGYLPQGDQSAGPTAAGPMSAKTVCPRPRCWPRAHARFGAALVNTRSTTWRVLTMPERAFRIRLNFWVAHPALIETGPLIAAVEDLFLALE